jgi:hypothetical protein
MSSLFRHASLVTLFTIAVPAGVVAMAITYAIWPSERRLAMMRPLSLAAIFSGLGVLSLGLSNTLQGISASPPGTITWNAMAAGLAEMMAALFIIFGSLTISWLLVAVGMRQSGMPR